MLLWAWVLTVTLCHTVCFPAHYALAAAFPDPQEEEALPDVGVDPDVSTQGEEELLDDVDSALRAPEKRMLKFLLPEMPQYWGMAQDTSMPDLGTKRGYNTKNFIRFGRGRDKNFLRFGRGRNQNFLRFGRSGLPADGGLLEAAKRARTNNFLRFGRTRNFLRFGRSGGQGIDDPDLDEAPNKRGADRNYLRFGRSTQEYNRSKSEDSSKSRSKRSYPSVYDILMLQDEVQPTWSPIVESMNSDDDEIEQSEPEPLQYDQERYRRGRGNSNFLRFGRQRNYLRFGKRSDVKSWYRPARTAVQYPRAHRNFLRFG